jgi:hypothetical protein
MKPISMVLAAVLISGSIAAQTLEVMPATTSAVVVKGRVMIDWQGKMYTKHN